MSDMPVITPAAGGPVEDTPARPRIDYGQLTLGEVAKLEDLSGQPVSALEDQASPKGKLLAALVFIASRRYGEPKTWDACLAVTVPEATAYLGLDDAGPAPVEGLEAVEDDDEGKG